MVIKLKRKLVIFKQKCRIYPSVHIEISGVCNAKCKYCCRGTKNHVSDVRFMSAKKFESILAHLHEIKILSNKKQSICLYNWSEAVLNPEINEIFNILAKYNKMASISSNFIGNHIFTNLDPENYKYLAGVTFSVCSLNAYEYKRIYGSELKKTLSNFSRFMEYKRKYNDNISVSVTWLKYKFNAGQELGVKKFFMDKFGVPITSRSFAYINDMHANISYSEKGVLDGYNLEEVRKDIYFDEMELIRKNYVNKGKKFFCPFKGKKYFVINEVGQIAVCCGVTSKDVAYNLGDILKLNKKEILNIKKSQNICKKCEQGGWPLLFFKGFFDLEEDIRKNEKK